MKPALTKVSLITAPAELPVSAAELRLHHLWTIYPETTDEYLEFLIKAATNHIETTTWRKLVSQTWRLYLDAWPVGGIELPFGAASSVGAVRWLDADANDTTARVTYDYIPAIFGDFPMVIEGIDGWPSSELYPVDPIRVDFVAGFGAAADVPADIRQAIQMLAAHWYEQREAVIVGTTVRKVPYAVDALIGPWKVRYG